MKYPDHSIQLGASCGPKLAEMKDSTILNADGEVRANSRSRLFFVGDNSSNANWGRAASLALRQLLSESFDITGNVAGAFFDLSTADAGYIGTLMPGRYYGLFKQLMRRRWRRPYSWYFQLEHWFGAKDLIDENPAVSVDNLLTHKRRYPALARMYQQAEQADFLLADGDGDIIFSTPPRRNTLCLLALMELGIRLKKPVFLVNSMISDCPQTGRNQQTLMYATRLMTQCRAVALRDAQSYEYVRREMPDANSFLVPDSLFTWYPLYSGHAEDTRNSPDSQVPDPETWAYKSTFDFSRPYICIGGGALAGSQPGNALQSYSNLVKKVAQLGYGICLTENDRPDSFLQTIARDLNVGFVPVDAPIQFCGAVLANARLFISGRYHPSIFASLGGTPCIFLATHAHKMGSLAEVLQYESPRQFNGFPGESEISEIVGLAKTYLAGGESLRVRIRKVAKSRCEEASQLPSLLMRHLNG
jgi:polysaccharide pyruvyl transferase WcaK-like protein